MQRWWMLVLVAGIGLGLGLAATGGGGSVTGDGAAAGEPWTPPGYGGDFGAVWHDGKAEMASYRLTFPRYGEMRQGTAVAVTVTEPFNGEQRVKADAVGEETYGVLKLNLMEDFPTGVYEYNLMTSVFVATEPANGLPAGSPTKVSFSSQEWCGQVWQQAEFNRPRRGRPGVRQTVHSYFEGQADRNDVMDHPAGGIAEEALMLWARGLAGPRLEAGESITVPVLRAMSVQRLNHREPAWVEATLTRSGEASSVDAAGETFAAELFTADVEGRRYEFVVATDRPARPLLELRRSDGYTLTLTGVERMPYWRMQSNADEASVSDFGLRPRGPGRM